MIWWLITLVSSAYGTVALVCARLVAGHLAWKWTQHLRVQYEAEYASYHYLTASRREIPAQPVIKPRALKHGDGPGRAPISRPPKPVKSVGRAKARCYCPTCGQKRRACKCEGGER